MSTIRTLLRATVIVGGSSAALLLGGLTGTAHADPALPVPDPNIGQQLIATAANAPQLLQSFATALGVTPAQAPVAPPPLATGQIRAPQQLPGNVPGAAQAPGIAAQIPGITPATPPAAATPGIPGLTAPIPGLTPAATPAPATAPSIIPAFPPVTGIPGTAPVATATAPAAPPMPGAQVDLPKMPFLPLTLPQQLALGDLSGLPIPHGVAAPGVPAAPAPGPTPATIFSPLSALP